MWANPNQFQVDIYANGSTTAETFVVTGGNGSDGSFPSYLGMGVHSTGQHGAMDVDFFGYKPGILLPTSNVNPGVRGDFNGDGTLDATDIRPRRQRPPQRALTRRHTTSAATVELTSPTSVSGYAT